jgi:hypothetical protein
MGRVAVKRHFKIKKTNKASVCRIIEDNKKCKREVHCRGLCSRHHTYFLRWKLIDKYGAKQKFVYVEASSYKINKSPKKGCCRVIENGKTCRRKTHGRGLCARHWLTFERHDLLKKYGTSSRKDPRTFALKKKIKAGVCRVKENGKDCKTTLSSRGLCSKHYLRFMRDGRINKFGT